MYEIIKKNFDLHSLNHGFFALFSQGTSPKKMDIYENYYEWLLWTISLKVRCLNTYYFFGKENYKNSLLNKDLFTLYFNLSDIVQFISGSLHLTNFQHSYWYIKATNFFSVVLSIAKVIS